MTWTSVKVTAASATALQTAIKAHVEGLAATVTAISVSDTIVEYSTASVPSYSVILVEGTTP